MQFPLQGTVILPCNAMIARQTACDRFCRTLWCLWSAQYLFQHARLTHVTILVISRFMVISEIMVISGTVVISILVINGILVPWVILVI